MKAMEKFEKMNSTQRTAAIVVILYLMYVISSLIFGKNVAVTEILEIVMNILFAYFMVFEVVFNKDFWREK